MVLQPLVASLFSGLGRGELGFKKSSALSLSVPDTPRLRALPQALPLSWGLPVPRLGVRKGDKGCWETGCGPGKCGQLLCPCFHSPGLAPWNWQLVRGGRLGPMEQDPVPSCLPLKIPAFSLPGKAGLVLALPGPQNPVLPPVLPLPLPSSFLGCVYLTSAFWCLNVCLSVSVTVSFSSPFCCWLQLT